MGANDSQASPAAARDVVIAGGGLIGLTLGVALARGGLKVLVVDAQEPRAAMDEAFDGRVSAIAYASCRLLGALGLWPRLAPDAQPINDIVVSDGRVRAGAAPFFLHFDHREIGTAPLGHLVENRVLRRALYEAAAREETLTLRSACRVTRVAPGAALCEAQLSDGDTARARLVISAEGRQSPLREAAGIKALAWRYNQTGIVATVSHEKPHEGVAQEYFLPSGPFAILPMTGNRASLVWTERADLAPAFLALGTPAFEAEVARRFGPYLGALACEGPRWSYPLSLHLAQRLIAERFALAGDSAHSIHPIAGQGFNLGLRDVAALSEVVIDAARLGLDIGAPSVLEQYQRWRRFDTVTLAAVTDGLNRLFSNDAAPLRLARGLGLAAVARLGPARRFFMRHAGGDVGALPRLLRGEPL